MPKDMFYNYDNEYFRNKKECPEIPIIDAPCTLNSPSNAAIIKDIRGDEIGIRAYAGQNIELYFHITGTIIDEEGDILNPAEYFQQDTFLFKLLDSSNRAAYTLEVPGNFMDDYGVLRISLSGKDLIEKEIKKDIYRIRVEAVSDEESCPIFYENDSFINFI